MLGHSLIFLVFSRISLYPYGGNTYVLSKAMFDAVGRENWQKYMYILQCTNADISIMTTVFNHGYSIHSYEKFGHAHHVHTVMQQFGSFKSTRQSKEVYMRGCEHPDIKNSTDALALCAKMQ